MAKLQAILAYLGRSDVREVVFQNDSPLRVRTGQKLQALSRQPLSGEHIRAIVAGSPLDAMFESARKVGMATGTFELGGQRYAGRVAIFEESVEVRVVRAERRRSGSPSGRFRRPSLTGLRAPGARPEPQRPAVARRPRAERVQEPEVIVCTPVRTTPPKRPPRPAGRRLRAVEPPGAGPTVADRGYAELIGDADDAASLSAALRALLREARTLGASDVHIASKQPARIRRLGRLEEYRPGRAPLGHARVEAMLMPLLGESKREQLSELGYADLSADLLDGGRVRVNISRHRGGLKGCFRMVAPAPATLSELGLPEQLAKVAMHHQGLVVVSGPSGSGKTTTMAALVHMFNESRPVHIITVEDPVEIRQPVRRALISQREVGVHTRSFQRALEAALREDPDIIAIGELRDRETVEMALSAAETGHLVIATMSTPSGARTIDRLIDMFPPEVQSQVRATLAGALKMIISQRLVPTRDGRRQVVAAELITGNVPLWSLIRDNKLFQLPSLLQRGRAYGMIRIDDSLSELVRQGEISVETARRYADDPRAIADPSGEAEAEAEAAEVARLDDPRGRFAGLGKLFSRRGA